MSNASENRAIVRRVIEGFLDPADPDLADGLFSPGYVDNNPSNPGLCGLENVKRSVAAWHRASPDTVNETRGLLAEGDLVAARWGESRISSGKVTESWDHFDALGLLRQLEVTLQPKGETR